MKRDVVKTVRDFIREQKAVFQAEMKVLDEKRIKKGQTYLSWASWYLMRYIRAEFISGIWAELEEGLENGIKAGKTPEEIVAWLRRVQEDFVDRVMNGSTPQSTNQLSNMIEAEKVDAYRIMAGRSGLDSGSLKYLLMTLDREI